MISPAAKQGERTAALDRHPVQPSGPTSPGAVVTIGAKAAAKGTVTTGG
jgi:hypothetical protein